MILFDFYNLVAVICVRITLNVMISLTVHGMDIILNVTPMLKQNAYNTKFSIIQTKPFVVTVIDLKILCVKEEAIMQVSKCC